MRNDSEKLHDIQEAIIKIDKYSVQGKEEFFSNELIQSWILMQLQIIGEAARSMSKEIHQKYPQIPWQDIIDFRNLLVHEYFRVDLKLVWRIVEKELPELKEQISLIIE
ncbi:DUF86 domain-containing protein [Pseudanabaena sp. ABRG5-3]|uniref:HepT-like ribonuclease domain-containing protein n=1 Tax=Pseudanabaena sp. ABRG5-3 TaxID=685565 RepID=UPI000DC73FB7|nr:DUF86 domain-containing protein [Pseudanabaena sp. ABRG5-3]BBC25444.1 nucleotidyltransferase [Pseudanabaena sp. ABRG5-3]